MYYTLYVNLSIKYVELENLLYVLVHPWQC